ncbi:hypothetical protein NQ317_012519 [Molorchus minor]|uniref:Uncharacterized protein n=1 Tax=Molorchus minor TaxID=1323400 RepID=A0ABQ9K290_9CUCU|nr:hypothetical protein NQ317_012519 [Molorchus minor]
MRAAPQLLLNNVDALFAELHWVSRAYQKPFRIPKNRCPQFRSKPSADLSQRFGQLQIKIGLAQLIRYFKISVNEKTPSSVDYLPFYFLLFPKGGIWLDFQKI